MIFCCLLKYTSNKISWQIPKSIIGGKKRLVINYVVPVSGQTSPLWVSSLLAVEHMTSDAVTLQKQTFPIILLLLLVDDFHLSSVLILFFY